MLDGVHRIVADLVRQHLTLTKAKPHSRPGTLGEFERRRVKQG